MRLWHKRHDFLIAFKRDWSLVISTLANRFGKLWVAFHLRLLFWLQRTKTSCIVCFSLANCLLICQLVTRKLVLSCLRLNLSLILLDLLDERLSLVRDILILSSLHLVAVGLRTASYGTCKVSLWNVFLLGQSALVENLCAWFASWNASVASRGPCIRSFGFSSHSRFLRYVLRLRMFAQSGFALVDELKYTFGGRVHLLLLLWAIKSFLFAKPWSALFQRAIHFIACMVLIPSGTIGSGLVPILGSIGNLDSKSPFVLIYWHTLSLHVVWQGLHNCGLLVVVCIFGAFFWPWDQTDAFARHLAISHNLSLLQNHSHLLLVSLKPFLGSFSLHLARFEGGLGFDSGAMLSLIHIGMLLRQIRIVVLGLGIRNSVCVINSVSLVISDFEVDMRLNFVRPTGHANLTCGFGSHFSWRLRLSLLNALSLIHHAVFTSHLSLSRYLLDLSCWCFVILAAL